MMLALAVSGLSVVRADDKADDKASGSQFQQILEELKRIRIALERQGPQVVPTAAKVMVKDAPMLGSKDAPLTMVMFSDFECAFCRQFGATTFKDLKSLYIDTGKMRLYHVDFPLDSHPGALLAAQAGRCAADQDLFWPFYERLVADKTQVTLSMLVGNGRAIGLDADRFGRCIEDAKTSEEIRQRISDAKDAGVRGTPSFVIGKSTTTGVDGELVLGAEPFGFFERKLTQFRP